MLRRLDTVVRRSSLVSLTCALALVPAAALAAGEPPVFGDSIDVELVEVEVRVVDGDGEPVHGLGREEFEVRVDGEPRSVESFYESSGLARVAPRDDPRGRTSAETADRPAWRIVVFLDGLHLRSGDRTRALAALERLLGGLAPDDEVAVAALERRFEIVRTFTRDRASAFDAIEAAVRGVGGRAALQDSEAKDILRILRDRGGAESARRSAGPDAGTLIRLHAAELAADAGRTLDALEGLVDTLGGASGRRLLLHVSSGIESRPGEALYLQAGADVGTSYDQAVGDFDLVTRFRDLGRAANRNRVTLYSLDATVNRRARAFDAEIATEGGSAYASPEAASALEEGPRTALEVATRVSGGRRLQLTSEGAQEMLALRNDLGHFYSLGVRAEAGDAGRLHRLQVRLRDGRGLRLRFRESFGARGREQRTVDATTATLLLGGGDNSLVLEARLGASTGRRSSARTPLEIEVPVASLTLVPRDGVHVAQLGLVVAYEEGRDRKIRIVRHPFHLAIPDALVERARGDRATFTLPLPGRPSRVALTLVDELGTGSSTLALAAPSPGERVDPDSETRNDEAPRYARRDEGVDDAPATRRGTVTGSTRRIGLDAPTSALSSVRPPDR